MKTKLIKDLKAGVKEMEKMPIGHNFSIIKGFTLEGEEKRTEYEKVSETHVKALRNYLYS